MHLYSFASQKALKEMSDQKHYQLGFYQTANRPPVVLND